VAKIRAALTEHEAAEDEHLWPVVDQLVPGGAGFASEARAQEQRLTATLQELAATDPRAPRYDELADQLQHALRAHVAFEDRVFLALRDVTTDDQRQQLGTRVRAAEIVESAKEHDDGAA